MRPRFHLAFPVRDIAEARAFYGGLLGCPEGRSAATWVDFDLAGHQIVAHLSHHHDGKVEAHDVDGDNVPLRHFGLILPWEEWHAWRDRLVAAEVDFLIEPHIRFAGRPGEQATMFFRDPSGNAMEFKSFRQDSSVFAKDLC